MRKKNISQLCEFHEKNIAFLLKSLNEGRRYAVLRGGTRSGKTYAALEMLLLGALGRRFRVASVVGISMSHLHRGAVRDWNDILKRTGVWEFVERRGIYREYWFWGEVLVEFFSADESGKLRGAQRDWLFINEVNLLSEEDFNELDVRTKNFVIIDFNPVSRFWLVDVFAAMGLDLEAHTCVTTYRDNPFLSPEQKAAIEQRQGLENWWRVYGAGEWGESQGRAWYNWGVAEVETDRWDVVGVDFGQGRSPHAAVGVRVCGSEVEAAELYYGHDLQELAQVLRAAQAYRIVGDPAQLDYINLLRKEDINIYPARKMQLAASFAALNKLYVRVHRASSNLIKEAQGLEWADAGKGVLRAGLADHAVDALRYAIHSVL